MIGKLVSICRPSPVPECGVLGNSFKRAQRWIVWSYSSTHERCTKRPNSALTAKAEGHPMTSFSPSLSSYFQNRCHNDTLSYWLFQCLMNFALRILKKVLIYKAPCEFLAAGVAMIKPLRGAIERMPPFGRCLCG